MRHSKDRLPNMCAVTFSVWRGDWTTSACVLLSMAVFMLTTGAWCPRLLRVCVVYLAALWRVGWDGESDKMGIKRPIFSHVCQAGQGCCLFEGGVTRLLQCGHRNTKQSRLCPRVFGKDLLSFLVLQFVQAQVVPNGWPPNRKHMESILTSQTLLYVKSLKSSPWNP